MPNLNLKATPILVDITGRFDRAVYDSPVLKALAENDLSPLLAYCEITLAQGRDNIAKAVAAESKRKAKEAEKLAKAEGAPLDGGFIEEDEVKAAERTVSDILTPEDILYGALSAMFQEKQGKVHTAYVGPSEQKKKGKASFDDLVANKVIFSTLNTDLPKALAEYKEKLRKRSMALPKSAIKAKAAAQLSLFDEKKLTPALNTFLAASRYSFASQQFKLFEVEKFDSSNVAATQFFKNLLKLDINATLLPFLRSDEMTVAKVKRISKNLERLAIKRCEVGSDVTSEEIEKVKQLLDVVHRVSVAKELTENGFSIKRTSELQERYKLLKKEGVAVHSAFQGKHFENIEKILMASQKHTKGMADDEAREFINLLLLGEKCSQLFPNLKYLRETGDKPGQWSQFNKDSLLDAIMEDRRNPHSSAAVIDTLFMQKQAGEFVNALIDVQDKNEAEQLRRRESRASEFKAYPIEKRAEFLKLIEITAQTDARYEQETQTFKVLNDFLSIARDIQPVKKSAADLEQKVAEPVFKTPAELAAGKAQEELLQKVIMQAEMYMGLVAQQFPSQGKGRDKVKSVQSNALLILRQENAALIIKQIIDQVTDASSKSDKILSSQLGKAVAAQKILQRITKAEERKESDFSRYTNAVVQLDEKDKFDSVAYYLTELTASNRSDAVSSILSNVRVEMAARKIVKIYPALPEEKQKVLEKAYSKDKAHLVQKEIKVDDRILLETTSPILEAMKRLDISSMPFASQESLNTLKDVIHTRLKARDFVDNYLVNMQNRAHAFTALKQALADEIFSADDVSYFAQQRNVKTKLSFLNKLLLIASDDPVKANEMVDAYASEASLAKNPGDYSRATSYLDSKNEARVMKQVNAFPAEVKKRAALFASLQSIDGFSREQFEVFIKGLPAPGRNFSSEQKVDKDGVMPENEWEKRITEYAKDPKTAALLAQLRAVRPALCRNDEVNKLQAFLRDVPFNTEFQNAIELMKHKNYAFKNLMASSNPGLMHKKLNEKFSDNHVFFKDKRNTAISTMYDHFEKVIQPRAEDSAAKEGLRQLVSTMLNQVELHEALEEKGVDAAPQYKALDAYIKLLAPVAQAFLADQKEKLGDKSPEYKLVESIVLGEQAALHAEVSQTFCQDFATDALKESGYDFYGAIPTAYNTETGYEGDLALLSRPVDLAFHQVAFNALKAAWEADPQAGLEDDYAVAMERFEEQARLPGKEFEGAAARIKDREASAAEERQRLAADRLRDERSTQARIEKQLDAEKVKAAEAKQQSRLEEDAARRDRDFERQERAAVRQKNSGGSIEDSITPASANPQEAKRQLSGINLSHILERKDDASMQRFMTLGNAASVLAAKHIKAKLVAEGKTVDVSDQKFVREIKTWAVKEMQNQLVMFNDSSSGPSPLDRWRAGIDAWSSSNDPAELNAKRELLFLDYQKYMRAPREMQGKAEFKGSVLDVALGDNSMKVLLDKWYQATKIDKNFGDESVLAKNLSGDALLNAQVAVSLTYRPDVFPKHQSAGLSTVRALYACLVALISFIFASTAVLIRPAEKLKEHAVNVTKTRSDHFGKFNQEGAFFQSRVNAAAVKDASNEVLEQIGNANDFEQVDAPVARAR